jgi:hypothetical protein
MVSKHHVIKKAKKVYDVGTHDVKKARSLVKIIQGAGKKYHKLLKMKATIGAAPPKQ